MTQRPTVRVTRRLPDAVEAYLNAHFDVTLNRDDVALGREALAQALTDYDAVVPTITDRIDADLLAMPGRRARILANFGAGTDHIDLKAAGGAGLVVTNTPDALTDATAEIAILLMLMAARRASEGERELRSGGWTGWRPSHLIGQGLTGKVLGLVGWGRIAQATAQRAEGLGMRIVYHSRRNDGDTRRMPSLEALCETADVVSLHVPGGRETHHLIDAAILKRMKPSAILVNTARGSVVDEAALAGALANGTIAAAGLDVYEREPAVTPELLACANAVLLPHLGSATEEARTAMGMQAARNLRAFFAGEEPPNRVA